MSSERPWVFLDTMIVAGLFAVSKKGVEDVLSFNKKEWRRAVFSLASKANLENAKYFIPRPVFHELMSMNKEWYDYIISQAEEGKEIFQSATWPIQDNILKKAAQYSYTCRMNQFHDNDGKMKSYDPLIAAYADEKKGYVITENQRDFPEIHFKITAVETAIVKGKEGILDRKIIFLLKYTSG